MGSDPHDRDHDETGSSSATPLARTPGRDRRPGPGLRPWQRTGQVYGAFHVWLVSPWIGLLRAGRSEHPLHVMDRCRIRQGRAIEVTGDVASVAVPTLRWDGGALGTGDTETEVATVRADGRGFLPNLRPGDHVSLHRDWVCDRLSPRDVRSRDRYTARHLLLGNLRTSAPAPRRIGPPGGRKPST